MDDPPDYSDPIIIPISITIPNPRRRPGTGRWEQLRTPIHPSYSDPDYFSRQSRAAETREWVQARFRGGVPRNAPLPLLGDPGYVAPPATQEAWARAQRRAQYAAGEIAHGDWASAAGHLLLGTPYPPEVDDPASGTVHNEGPADEPPAAPARSPDLDAKIAETQKDFDSRLADALDENHIQAAEQDRLGNPVTRGDRVFDHENEVAQAKQGLERKLKQLEDKIQHDSRYVRPKPDGSIQDGNDLVGKIREFMDKLNDRLPGLKIRQGK